jgi:hypothetical protein
VYLRVIPAIGERANMQEIGPSARFPAPHTPNPGNLSTTRLGD